MVCACCRNKVLQIESRGGAGGASLGSPSHILRRGAASTSCTQSVSQSGVSPPRTRRGPTGVCGVTAAPGGPPGHSRSSGPDATGRERPSRPRGPGWESCGNDPRPSQTLKNTLLLSTLKYNGSCGLKAKVQKIFIAGGSGSPARGAARDMERLHGTRSGFS